MGIILPDEWIGACNIVGAERLSVDAKMKPQPRSDFYIEAPLPFMEQAIPELLEIPWHFTASAVVVSAAHILLIHHKRIGSWLPPGGHIEGGELPHQAAVRETFEEAGVRVRVLSVPMPVTQRSDAFFLPQPLCMHAVEAVEKGTPLYHLDIAYLCMPDSEVTRREELPPIVQTAEVHEARWVPLAELFNLPLAKNVPELAELLSRLAHP